MQTLPLESTLETLCNVCFDSFSVAKSKALIAPLGDLNKAARWYHRNGYFYREWLCREIMRRVEARETGGIIRL